MRRRHDWPERLNETIEAARARAFRWGRHDCALFVADCVQAMTGTDPAAGWRGGYGPAAARVDLADLGDRTFGAPIDPALARRGDVALIAGAGRIVAGVVIGGLVAAPGREGLVAWPLAAAIRAWRVG